MRAQVLGQHKPCSWLKRAPKVCWSRGFVKIPLCVKGAITLDWVYSISILSPNIFRQRNLGMWRLNTCLLWRRAFISWCGSNHSPNPKPWMHGLETYFELDLRKMQLLCVYSCLNLWIMQQLHGSSHIFTVLSKINASILKHLHAWFS